MNNALRTSGLVLFVLFVASGCLIGFAQQHTLEREAGFQLRDVVACLEILWMIIAVVFATRHWRKSTRTFKVLFWLNGSIVAILVAELMGSLWER